jgi:hypothetical protein
MEPDPALDGKVCVWFYIFFLISVVKGFCLPPGPLLNFNRGTSPCTTSSVTSLSTLRLGLSKTPLVSGDSID